MYLTILIHVHLPYHPIQVEERHDQILQTRTNESNFRIEKRTLEIVQV